MNETTFTNSYGETLTVRVNDVVEFKYDTEQYAKVIEIIPSYRTRGWTGPQFVVEGHIEGHQQIMNRLDLIADDIIRVL